MLFVNATYTKYNRNYCTFMTSSVQMQCLENFDNTIDVEAHNYEGTLGTRVKEQLHSHV
jgi:hypothetical protein